jgi:hypothetical protein
MEGTFTVKIEMGNDAMQSRADLATAMDEISKKLRSGHDYGNVMDENGNKVGEWSTP